MALLVTFAIIGIKCHKTGILLASPDKVNILVKNGTYSKVRHPALLGIMFAFWGILLIIGNLSALVTGIIMIFVIWGWAMLEEKVLIEKFGDDCKKYQKEVAMFIPKLRSLEKRK